MKELIVLRWLWRGALVGLCEHSTEIFGLHNRQHLKKDMELQN
jgi:hypothetical protein